MSLSNKHSAVHNKNQTTGIFQLNERLQTIRDDDLLTIKNELNNLNEKMMILNKDKPRYFRQRDECYHCVVRDVAMTTTDSEYLYILNPVGSGKTIYLYNTNMSIFCSTHLNQRHYAELTIRKINTSHVTGGTDILVFNRGNLNIGNTDEGIAIIRSGYSISGALGTLEEIHLNDEGISQHLDYIDEYVEIPEGFGLAFSGHANDDDVELTINLRYIETEQSNV